MAKKKSKGFIALFISLLLAILILNDPFQTQLGETDVESYTSEKLHTADVPDTLKVMTWNIKFGGGRIDFFFINGNPHLLYLLIR